MLRTIVGIVLLLHGLVAAYCGYLLMRDPSGELLGLDVKLLFITRFVNYFIPGLILFAALGIGSIVAAIAALFKSRLYTSIVMASGLVIVGWIVAQIWILQLVFFLQFVIAAIGCFVLISGAMLRHREQHLYKPAQKV